MNNGNVNNNNANNRFRSRPVRRAAPASECQGERVSVRELYNAMRCARRSKKPNNDQLKFELRWFENLLAIQKALNAGTWRPGRSTSFIAVLPKARQIHAPAFADMVVHHLVVPKLEAEYDPTFIHDSYANRRGKGTHAAVRRLGQFMRQVASGQGRGWYLQLDIRNFFYSINRRILWGIIKPRLIRAGASKLVLQVVHALLAKHVEQRGVLHLESPAERLRVPPHKRLENAAPDCGLPIGNLPSQFLANVYMDVFDQFVKHELKAKRYLRYVDDFVLVHRDRAQLERMQVRDDDLVINSNLELRLDGFPKSNQRDPADPGVVVYWRDSRVDGWPMRCMAIDRYDRVADNLAAIAATLDAMRAIERHGGAEILNRAFTGFVAIEGPKGRHWSDVLDVDEEANIDMVRAAYRLSRTASHPDRGGDNDSFHEVQQAWQAFCKERGIHE